MAPIRRISIPAAYVGVMFTASRYFGWCGMFLSVPPRTGWSRCGGSESSSSIATALIVLFVLSFSRPRRRGSHCRHNRRISVVVNCGRHLKRGFVVPQEEDKDVDAQPTGRHA